MVLEFSGACVNRSSALFLRIFLGFFILFVLTACGSGGGGTNSSQGLQSVYLDLFPLNENYAWHYNNSAVPVRFSNKLTVAGNEVSALSHPTGANEYFHTSSTELKYFGVYIPSIVVQTTTGYQSYTGDVKFDQPLMIFSRNWLSGNFQSFSGTGSVNISPTYGYQPITYSGSVQYLGVSDITVPLGTYSAHHVAYSFTVYTTIQGQQFSIPFSTELWLVEDVGIVKRLENGINFNLTSVEGMPGNTSFTADDGAPLPPDKIVMRNASSLSASDYSGVITYNGATSDWLSLTVNNTTNRFQVQPTTTDLRVGVYTATIRFISTTQTPFEMAITYTIKTPVVVAPINMLFDLRGSLELNKLVQTLSLQNTGKPASIRVSASAGWIKLTDVTINPANPLYKVELDAGSLFNQTGPINASIHVVYDNGYTTGNVIDIPIQILLPPGGLNAPVVNFSNVSGRPANPDPVILDLFGSQLNANNYQANISYNGLDSSWLSITIDNINNRFLIAPNRSDLAPGIYTADVSFAATNGSVIPVTVSFTLEAPSLSGPTSLVWNINEQTTANELIKRINFQQSGELLNWSISSSVSWIKSTTVSNDLVNGGLSDIAVKLNDLSSLENGQYHETLTVTYSGNFRSPTNITIPITVYINFPVVTYPLPYVLYEGRAEKISVNGQKITALGTRKLYVGNQEITNVSVIDDHEASATIPALSAGEYLIYVSNALGIDRGAGRIVVKPILNYPDAVISVPGRVQSLVYDEEREAFFGVFASETMERAARIQYQNGSWVLQYIDIVSPLALTSKPDGSELLVTTAACGIKHVNPDTLIVSQPYPNRYCTYNYFRMIEALNDGQILFADTNQWPTVWSYPDFSPTQYPSIHTPFSKVNLKRNKMLWAESPTISGIRQLYMYDTKTDIYNLVLIEGEPYFLRQYIAMNADGSRLIHFNNVYNGSLNYIGSLDAANDGSPATQPTPDGLRAVRFEYGTQSMSVFDISGSTGPFPKISADVVLPDISTIQDIQIPLDGSVAFMFGSYLANYNFPFEYKMFVRNLP